VAKRSDVQTKARLLRHITAETRLVTASLRPLRLAFLLNADASSETVLTCLRHNSSVWGGIFNALIPTDGKALSEDWWQVLRNHDPDMIIGCGSISGRLLGQLGEWIQPFDIQQWSDDTAAAESSALIGSGSVPMTRVLHHIYKTHRPIEESGICLPSGASDPLLKYCAAADFGITDDELTQIYKEPFHANIIHLPDADFGRYMDGLSRFRDFLSPLDMTRWGLSTSSEGGGLTAGLSIVLLSHERWIEDLCVFWNLRMCPEVIYKDAIALPIDLLRAPSNLHTLAAWCDENIGHANYMNLVSVGVNKRRLVRLRDRLRPLLGSRIRLVDVWYDHFWVHRFRTHEDEQSREVTIEDVAFRLAVLQPSFSDSVSHGDRWAVDADFTHHFRPMLGYVPPRFAGLNRLLFGEPCQLDSRALDRCPARVAQARLSYRAGPATEHIRGRLPSAEELFVSFLEHKGYRSSTTDKCRYVTGIARLLGGYDGAATLRDERVQQLFERMCRMGPHTIARMSEILKPGDSQETVTDFAQNLARNSVLLRGYTIKCPACDLTQWYDIRALSETMSCAGCLSAIQPPPDAPFSYKLNELMVRGIQQGAIPVLLTILTLSTLARHSFLHVPGIEVRRGGIRTDVDLLASCDGELLLAECKDLRQGCSRESVREIVSALEELAHIAERVGAKVIFLTHLTDAAPRHLAQGIDRVARHHALLGIHMISGAQLTRGYLRAAEVGTAGPGSVEPHVLARLRDFMPKPRDSMRDGWLREHGLHRAYG
jgi:hypothetical protein